MPQQVYDKTDHYTPPSIRQLEEGSSAGETSNSNRARDEEIKNLERQFDQPAATSLGGSGNTPPDQLNRGYTDDDSPKRGGSESLRNILKSKKAKFFLASGVGLFASVLILFAALMFFASTLKIPHLMENITQYAFVRVTQQFSRSSTQVVSEALAVQATEGKVGTALQAKYDNLRAGTWGKLDKFRPNKVWQNLGKTSGLELNYRATPLGRELLTGMTLNGETVAMKQVAGIAKWTPFVRDVVEANNRADFWRRAAPELTSAMKANDVGPITRSLAARQLRKEMGISLAGWALAKFKDAAGKPLAGDAALLENTRQQYGKTSAVARANPTATTGELKNAVEETKRIEQEVVKDDAKLLNAIKNNGGVAPEIVETLDKTVGGSVTKTALGVANPIYNIMVPLCIIFDGSMNKAQPIIDNQVAQQQAVYTDLASKADQQKHGTIDSKDVGAFNAALGAGNESLGDISQSNAMQRANTGSYGSGLSPGAEQNAMASYDYSLLNVLAEKLNVEPDNAAVQAANSYASSQCAVLTNLWVAGGLAVANIGISIATLGTGGVVSEGAGQAVGAGAKAVVSRITQKLAAQFAAKAVEKNGIKVVERAGISRLTGFLMKGSKFVGKQVAIIGTTIGLTELAKIVVINNSNQLNNGLAQGADLANIADSGANIMAGETSRKIFGGRPMTDNETAESDAAGKRFGASLERKKNAYTRYIAISNPRSLVSRLAFSAQFQLSVGAGKTLVDTIGSVINPFKSLAKVASVISPKTYALATPDAHYGNVQFGWSEDEESHIENDPSYGMLENERILRESGQEEAIKTKYGPCFTDSLGSLLSKADIARDSDGKIVQNEGLCSPQNLSYNNAEFGPEMVFRWRVAQRKTATLNQLTELAAGPQAATDTVAVTTPNAGGPVGGTTKELAAQIANNPNIKFQTDSGKQYFQKIIETGGQTSCGGVQTDPRLLGTVLTLAQKYKLTLGVFTDGHSCNNGYHPKGKAVDINGVDPIDGSPGGTGPQIRFEAGEQPIIRKFYADAGQVLSEGGGGGLGQIGCFSGEKPTLPPNVSFFGDSCNHIHMDIGQR